MAYNAAIIFIALLVGYVCARPGPLKGPTKGDSDAYRTLTGVDGPLKAKGINRASIIELSWQVDDADGTVTSYIKIQDSTSNKIYLAKIFRDKKFRYSLKAVQPSSRSATIRAF